MPAWWRPPKAWPRGGRHAATPFFPPHLVARDHATPSRRRLAIGGRTRRRRHLIGGRWSNARQRPAPPRPARQSDPADPVDAIKHRATRSQQRQQPAPSIPAAGQAGHQAGPKNGVWSPWSPTRTESPRFGLAAPAAPGWPLLDQPCQPSAAADRPAGHSARPNSGTTFSAPGGGSEEHRRSTGAAWWGPQGGCPSP